VHSCGAPASNRTPVFAGASKRECLHPNTSSLSLPIVWEYIKKKMLEGAHNSVVDAIAQTVIVLHPLFINFIDKTKSIRTINEFFVEKYAKRFTKEGGARA